MFCKVVSAPVALVISEVKLAFVVLILVVNPDSAFVALATSAVKLAFVELTLVVNPLSAVVALVASAFILFDSETVSLANLLDNIAEVSNRFNFSSAVALNVLDKPLICLLTNKVLAMVLSATVESCVTVTGRPNNFGDVKVLFEKVSVPVNVAKVPEVGKMILLAAVVVMVKSPMPLEIMLFAMEIVLPLLLKPVPPFSLGTILVTLVVESAKEDFEENKV